MKKVPGDLTRCWTRVKLCLQHNMSSSNQKLDTLTSDNSDWVMGSERKNKNTGTGNTDCGDDRVERKNKSVCTCTVVRGEIENRWMVVIYDSFL